MVCLNDVPKLLFYILFENFLIDFVIVIHRREYCYNSVLTYFIHDVTSPGYNVVVFSPRLPFLVSLFLHRESTQ